MVGEVSVHLMGYPSRAAAFEGEVVEHMEAVREVCSAGLALRKRFNLRLRLPLLKATVIGAEVLFFEGYKKFIMEELNVKKVVLEPGVGKNAREVLTLNFEKCGKRLGKGLQEVLKKAKAGEWRKLSNGSVVVGEAVLSDGDFSLKLVPNFEGENYEAIGNRFLLILDTEVTEELENEGLARDFTRFIQNERKNMGLDVGDKISVSYFAEGGGDVFSKKLGANLGYVKEQTLAEKCASAERAPEGAVLCDLEDFKVFVSIKKV